MEQASAVPARTGTRSTAQLDSHRLGSIPIRALPRACRPGERVRIAEGHLLAGLTVGGYCHAHARSLAECRAEARTGRIENVVPDIGVHLPPVAIRFVWCTSP